MDTCYKTSDNKYRDCPPRMSDGRHFTDYRPVCDVNNTILSDNNLEGSFNYRNFLQENGAELMEKNREYACAMNCCGPCDSVEGFESTMLPEKTKQKTTNTSAKFVKHNQKGLGLGRDYYPFPVESCENLPKAWPQPKQGNDCMTLPDRYALFGDANNEHVLNRKTIPGGGVTPCGANPCDKFGPIDPGASNFMTLDN